MGGPQDNQHGIEAAPEAAPKVSATQERAQLAMEVLEGKSLHSPASRRIDNIDINESIETQVENLKHLYLGSVLLLTYLKKTEKLGKGSLSLNTFRNLSVSSSNLSPEQFSALKKLRAMASNKDSVVSSFWNSEIMSHLKDSVADMTVAATAAVDLITGKEDRDVPEGERTLYDKTRDFANDHPVIAGTVAVAGAMAVGYGLFKMFSSAKNKLSGGSKSPSNNSEGTAESIWKWSKRLSLVLGGTWVAGQILGLEEVQKWLKKKGLDVNKNKISKALVLFANFNILEGIQTLKRGVRDDGAERRQTDAANEFGLNNSISVWVCADKNCKKLMDMDDEGHTYSIAAPAALAKIPFIGAIFTNEKQLADEQKLRRGLNGMRDEIESIEGWEKMTIDDVLKALYKQGTFGSSKGPRAARELSDKERAEVSEQEETLVNQPSTQFGRLMTSIDSNQSMSRKEKVELFALIGGPEVKDSLLGDLHYMESAIPGMWDNWKGQAFDVVAGAGSLSGEGHSGQAMVKAFGLDIDDRDEMADLVKAREILSDNIGTEMERTELEVVRGLITEVEGFRDFIEGIGSGEKFDSGDLSQFRDYKKRFSGPDGIFKQVKIARQNANSTEFMDQGKKFGEWTIGDEGKAIGSLYLYSLFGYTMEAFVSADATGVDKGVGLALTMGTVAGTYGVVHPIASAKLAGKSTLATWRAVGWSKSKILSRQMQSIRTRMGSNLTIDEAGKSLKWLREIRRSHMDTHHGITNSMSSGTMNAVRQQADTLISDLKDAMAIDDFGRATEATRLRAALKSGSVEHVDLIVKQVSEYTGAAEDSVRRAVEAEIQAGRVDVVVDSIMEARIASEATDQINEVARASAKQRLSALGTYFSKYADEGAEMMARNTRLVTLLSENGVDVSADIAMRLGRSSPSLLGAIDDPTLVAAEIEKLQRVMKVDDVSGIADKARFAMKAERALLVIGIVVDIFAIGMSLYRIKDLEEMIANASNPAIRDIYKDKLLRENANIALSGVSIVVSVSAIALQSSAVVGALGGVIGSAAAASAASASTGVGIALIPIVIVAGGVMHIADVMDEGKMEIAREKEDWKQLSPADLYRQWVTMVGTNDSEELVAFFNWKNVAMGFTGISYLGGGYDEYNKRMEGFRAEKVVTRRELVGALVEKQLKLFGGSGDLVLSGYAMQYMEASLGADFDAETIEMAKESIGNAAAYARMMTARDHIAIRQEFFRGDMSDYLGEDFAITSEQTRLTTLQISILPPSIRRDYKMLIGMTPYADMVRDGTVFDVNAAVIPVDYDVELENTGSLNAVLGDFGARVRTHSEAKLLSSEHRPVFERLSELSDNVILQKINEIQTIYSILGTYPTNVAILLPTLELYAQYKGIQSGFDATYPSSPGALDKWCFDLLASHSVPAGTLSVNRAMRIKSDDEVMRENGMFDDKFLYVLHKIAVDVFGYAGAADEESMKKLYSASNANVFGIYWDGNQWVVQEAGMEFDNKLTKNGSADQLIRELLGELERYGDDLFEETGDSIWVSSRSAEDKEFYNRSENIADLYRDIIESASAEYATASVEAHINFEEDATEYIKKHTTGDAHVILPGHLIVKGLMAGKENLGLFSYRYEDGKVVCYQLREGAELEAPLGEKGAAFESFEVAESTKASTTAMYKDLDEIHSILHASNNELDIPKAVDALIDAKRVDVDTFVAGLASFPTDQQERFAIAKAAEIDEFRRVVELSVLTEAASGSVWAFRWSDDVDSKTIDEQIQGNLSSHQTFNYHPVLREHWEKLSDVSASISNNVGGERYSSEYMIYFDQAMSLALAKSMTLKRNIDTGDVEIQGWKALDMDQFDRHISKVLLYDEWMKEYKGEDVGETSGSFRFEFKKSCMTALED